nr:zinc finger, CCHC-type [Tanacetum cinerariifolium]
MSSMEAEYIAASEAAMEVIWIRKFISGLGVVPSNDRPMDMYCDNTGDITITDEPGVQKGAKHFRIKYHYIREDIQEGDIRILKVHTDNNLVDSFKKPMSCSKHAEYARNIGRGPTGSFMSILKKEKLYGSNFLDWCRNLRIVLWNEQKLHHLEEALLEAPPATGTTTVCNAYTCRVVVQQEDYDQFVQNYIMHNMRKTISELHAMLKLAEKGIPKKASAILAIRRGQIQKYKPQARGNKKNKGTLDRYVRNDNRAAVEAIGSFDLTLPSGMMETNQTTNNNSIRSILKREKLYGSNFLDWCRNLRIVLWNEQKLHHLEEALLEAPPATGTTTVCNAYACRVVVQQEVDCLMLVSMTPQIQKNLEDRTTFEIL